MIKGLLSLALAGASLAVGGAALGQTTGDAAAGEDVFLDRCALCHVAEGGGPGPSLKGVVGRKAASVPGFAYSDALKASARTWTASTLDEFLTDPAKSVPGTAMPIKVPDAKERADLISYLTAHP